MATVTIALRNGKFTADEALAVAIFRKFSDRTSYKVIRTDDMSVVNASNIAIGIGGDYDPPAMRFDYHFFRHREYKSSSALVLEFAEVEPSRTLEYAIREVEMCNDGNDSMLGNILEGFNLKDVYSTAQDEAFARAVQFSVGYIER